LPAAVIEVSVIEKYIENPISTTSRIILPAMSELNKYHPPDITTPVLGDIG